MVSNDLASAHNSRLFGEKRTGRNAGKQIAWESRAGGLLLIIMLRTPQTYIHRYPQGAIYKHGIPGLLLGAPANLYENCRKTARDNRPKLASTSFWAFARFLSAEASCTASTVGDMSRGLTRKDARRFTSLQSLAARKQWTSFLPHSAHHINELISLQDGANTKAFLLNFSCQCLNIAGQGEALNKQNYPQAIRHTCSCDNRLKVKASQRPGIIQSPGCAFLAFDSHLPFRP